MLNYIIIKCITFIKQFFKRMLRLNINKQIMKTRICIKKI